MFDKTTESIWTNQQLFHYRDNIYRSDSIIDLSISSSTKDYQIFSPLSVLITISNINDKSRRNYTLNYSNLLDLLTTLKDLTQKADLYHGTNFIKRYHNDRYLSFEFKTVNDSDQVSIIGIFYNETDFGKIVVPRHIFRSIATLLKKIEDKFITHTFSLKSDLRQIKMLLNQEELIRSIKVLPSNLQIPGFYKPEKNKENDVPEEVIEDSQLNELDKFVGGSEMSNISLHEIDSINKEIEKRENGTKNTTIEYKSPFIEQVLNLDCNKIDGLFAAVATSPNPICTFAKTISKTIYGKENFNFLPGINDVELKSASYISKLIFTSSIQNYARNGIKIPGTTTSLIYSPDEKLVTEDHLNLAYDLLMISIYVRKMRSKLEVNNPDSKTNKSLLYLMIRCFTDIYYLSFLVNKKQDLIRSMMISRFNYFKTIGLFNNYDKYLEMYSCTPVSIQEYTETLDECISKVFGKKERVLDIHNGLFKNQRVVLPSDNKLNLEQITNELVPLEVAKKLNYDATLKIEPSKLVLSYLAGEVKPTIDKKEHETNLVRFVKRYVDDIPEGFRSEFINYCKDIKFDNFDYSKFDLSICGENIVKGIYEWNETSDKKEKYTDFYLRCENGIMTKDLILNKVISTKLVINVKEKDNLDQSIESIVLDLD